MVWFTLSESKHQAFLNPKPTQLKSINSILQQNVETEKEEKRYVENDNSLSSQQKSLLSLNFCTIYGISIWKCMLLLAVQRDENCRKVRQG